MHFQRLTPLLMILLATALPLAGNRPAAGAEILELKNGGRIHGELVDADKADDASYVIATAGGGRVTIPRSSVERVVTLTDAQAEYHRRARAAADTADAHWELAEWCREQKLRDEYRQQLDRILELDPDHESARRALGFRKVGGKWTSRDEIMAARGLVLYEGKYYTRQHVELLERAKETKLSVADWNSRLGRWRRWLTSRRQDRADEALREIRAIVDPEAAPAVVGLLRQETDYDVKRLLIDVAAQLDHQASLDALVELSIADPDEELRHQCLEYLIQSGRPGIARLYIQALRHQDNVVVNRAAEALQAIGDGDSIGPLINALVTKHRQVTSGGSADQHSYMFTPSGGTAMNFGGGGPKVVTQPVENPAVLAALVSLAGGTSFGYDQAAWRAWLSAQAKAHPVDVRRDE